MILYLPKNLNEELKREFQEKYSNFNGTVAKLTLHALVFAGTVAGAITAFNAKNNLAGYVLSAGALYELGNTLSAGTRIRHAYKDLIDRLAKLNVKVEDLTHENNIYHTELKAYLELYIKKNESS